MFWYKLFRQTICFSILLLPMSVNMFYFGILFILVFNLCLLRDFFHLHILRTFVYIALSHGSLLSHQYSLRYRANMWSVCHMGLNVPVVTLKKRKKFSEDLKLSCLSEVVTYMTHRISSSVDLLMLPVSLLPLPPPPNKAETGRKWMTSLPVCAVHWGYMAFDLFLFWWCLWVVIPLASSFTWGYFRMTFLDDRSGS